MIHIGYEAFVFDLDDTLVNTSMVVSSVMESWCEENGIDFIEASKASLGTRTRDTVARIAPHLDAPSEAKKIEERESAALAGLQAISGAQALLSVLPLERWAVVTSSSLVLAKAKLAETGLPIPGVIVAAECVTNGKPDPEPYVLAAERLGCRPESCLAFEDADTGVKSALNAGCSVFVIGSVCTIKADGIVGGAVDYSELKVTSDGPLTLRHAYIQHG